MPRFEVTTFGEGGLRLGVPAGKRLQTATNFDVHVAGAEANVVCTLARLGHATGWVSCVADSAVGERVMHTIRAAGVNAEGVLRKPGVRTGIYFIEHAHAPRPTKVHYDRDNTGLALLQPDEVDWDKLLDTSIIHLTGITAGLSPSCLDIVSQALMKARSRGVTTSFDVNFRQLLWAPAKARRALEPLLKQVDVLFCKLQDAASVFDLHGDPPDVAGRLAALSGARQVIVSNGQAGVTGWQDGKTTAEPVVETVLLDRAGAGDALVAGVLHGILNGRFERGLRYGQVLAAMTMSQHGDRVITSADEMEAIADGGRVDIER